MKKIIILFIFTLTFQSNWAQKVLDNYKYVIVPKRFEFQNKPNSYRINTLTKYFLDKKGFNTLLDDQVLPDDVSKNRCLALNVKLIKYSNMFRTDIKVAFINCKNKIIYTSGKGTSRDKEYGKSYHEAITGAFNSFNNFKYSYTPILARKNKLVNAVKPIINKNISNIKKNPKAIKINKKAPAKVILPVVAKLKVKIKKPLVISGLYEFNKEIYEISEFKNYFIFSKHIRKGDITKMQPLGFIYKTSKKGNYLVKTTNTFTGYLLQNGNFVIDEVDKDGTITSKIFIKNDN